MISLKKFEPNLLKIDKRSYKNNGIYRIGYITIKKNDDYENIYVTTGILTILVLSINRIFAMVVTI